MEAWTDLYKELAEEITTNLTDVAWVDLWHKQISFLTSELPFPTPAVFIAFKTLNIEDKGLLIQDCDTQIDFYLFYETFSDTYEGSYNQSSAIEFMRTLTDLHVLFHGTSGENYNEMRRVDLNNEDSDNAGNLYRISFACNIEDASAKKDSELKDVTEIEVTLGSFVKPSTTDTEPLYLID
jgi:hypothetical protein